MIHEVNCFREVRATQKKSKTRVAKQFMSADVTDCELVAKTLEEAQSKMGQITGIIHGAGNLADKIEK